MKPLIVPLPGNNTLAESLAGELGGQVVPVEFREFPDGEAYVRVTQPCEGRDVIAVCTMHPPDDNILPLVFLADTAKELGANRIGLVAPYLAYMRQDRRFESGEAITSTSFAKLISSTVDWLVTIDPHLHRRASLDEIYSIPARVEHAAPLVAAWIKENIKAPVLIGPDMESEQWVAAVAEEAGAPHVVLEKIRRGDRDVEVSVPEVERWADSTPVIVDDIISTARTMIETVGHLKRLGLGPAVCVGIHAVFADDAFEELKSAGAGEVVTCNTIAHPSNEIDVSGLLADAARKMSAAS